MSQHHGNILNRIVYDSFGQVTSETNPDFDFRFGYTGREWDDATGLMYYRARYYDPVVGRFLSEDPIGEAQINKAPVNWGQQ
ncbi:MAG: RHS repeat-associated core domain-containing protein [Leptolyngbya sp. SIOISBB]|nr:RHS repeat-associated core domain-containing protein [Leptolyngbya sp. SIOISBB]